MAHVDSTDLPERGEPQRAHRLFSDHPIRGITEDELHATVFVERLIRPLLDWSTEDSLVVGLYGPWGAGKSSILNLLEAALRREPWQTRVTVARFDPWLYGDESALLQGFFGALQAATKSAPFLTPERKVALREALSGMSRWVLPMVATLVSAHTGAPSLAAPATAVADAGLGLALRGDEPSFDEQKAKAKTALQKRSNRDDPGRVVVLIDDLDRVQAEEIRATLKLIRLIADLPYVTYVVAMDYGRVRTLLLERPGTGDFNHAYLEKIVQVPLQIPPISRQTVRRLLVAGLDQLFERDGERRPSIEADFEARGIDIDDALLWRLRNLRDRARILNLLHFKLLSGPDRLDVDPVDMTLVAFLETFYPSVVERVRVSKDFLTAESSVLSLVSRAAGREADAVAARRRTLNAIVVGDEPDERIPPVSHDGTLTSDESLFGRQYEVARVRMTVALLFPNAESGAEPTADDLVDWRRSNRITSPERFDRYFMVPPPGNEVSDAYVESWLDAVTVHFSRRIDDGRPHREELLAAVRALDPAKQRSLLGKASDRLRVLSPSILGPLASLVAAGVRTQIVDESDGADFVRAVLRALSDSRSADGGDATRAQTTAAHAAFADIVEAAADPIAAWSAAANHVTAWLRRQRTKERIAAEGLPDDLVPVAAAGMKRVDGFFQNQGDLLNLDGQQFSSAVWRWRDLLRVQGRDYVPIRMYLRRALEADPTRLPMILGLFAGWSSDDVPTFDHTSTRELCAAANEVLGWIPLLRACVRYERIDEEVPSPYDALVEAFIERIERKASSERDAVGRE